MERVIAVDPFYITVALDEFLNEVPSLNDLWLYFGVSSNPDLSRLKAHYREHVIERARVLMNFDTRYGAFVSEMIAIGWAHSNSEKFKGVLNKGKGFEEEALRGKGSELHIYAFLTKHPFEKRVNEEQLTGARKQVSVAEEHKEVSAFCIVCQKNLAISSAHAHAAIHARVNIECSFCCDKFGSAEKLSDHMLLHTTVARCPKAGCNFVGNLYEIRNSHFKVSHI